MRDNSFEMPKGTPREGADARRQEWADESETEASKIEGARGEVARFLLVRVGESVSFVELREGGEWIVGRRGDATIVVEDPQVSRRHARVRCIGGALTLEDLGSRNGTVVNGERVQRTVVSIAPGDVVELGRGQIVVAGRSTNAAALGAGGASAKEGSDVVVADPEMTRVYERARKVAAMPTTVLLLGETGSGKDVLARRVHAWSGRADGPFVRVNCGAIPESIVESELYGHERGAFTGADKRRLGYFEVANGGTLFLDEIGELSLASQVKLLHVLENRAVVRVGGTGPTPIDVRVVCATHRDLERLVADGRFRADLYYRIGAFKIRIPPLRERPTEIALLANVFARQLAAQVGAPSPTVSPAAITFLARHGWPGNVRELRNAVEHAFVMAEGATLRPEHFPIEAGAHEEAPPQSAARSELRARRDELERRIIEEALASEGGNQTRAAARLGMPRRTLVHKLTQYRRAGERGGSE